MNYFKVKNKKMCEPNTTSKGFTLVETLVAISILLLAILGPLSIASKGVNTSIYARDQVTAFYLAQEAIEYIKNLRDTNAIAASGPDWAAYKTAINSCTATAGCTIDTVSNGGAGSIGACSNRGGCSSLYIDSSGHYTQAAVGTQSKFSRQVKVYSTTNPDEQKVVVTMTWQTVGQNKTFSIQENLYNIY